MKFIYRSDFKWFCLKVWTLGIWIGSLMPSPPPTVENGDKVQHFIAYGVWAVLALRLRPQFVSTWFMASAMGVCVEFAQALTPWRTFDVADMLANAAGAFIGLLICRFVLVLKR